MTMALGKRKRSRQRGYERPTGREPHQGERNTEQSYVDTQRPLRSWNLPNGQVQHPLGRKGRTMVAVREISWEEASAPGFEQTTRQAWREAVAEIAERAKQTLPECNGRVDKAVAIVLNGDVELLPDGQAKIASQSHGATQYVVCNGTCACKDFPKAPSGWCKHRIAAGMQKRATALVQKKLSAGT